MSGLSWVDACNAAVNRSLEGMTVAWGAVVSTAFIVCAAASGLMFFRWRRLDRDIRSSLWKHYGWFTGLMCFGCFTGAVSYAAWSQFLVNLHQSDVGQFKNEPGTRYLAATSAYARALRSLIVFEVIYPFTFLFIVISKLLVLDRLMLFCKLKVSGKSSRWNSFERVSVGAIVACNLVGLCGNIVAAVHQAQAADIFDSLVASNATADMVVKSQSFELTVKATNFVAIYMALETAILLIIVVAFVVVAVASARRFRLYAKSAANLQQTSLADRTAFLHLRRQIWGTCGIVFLSFLLRALYTTMSTTAAAFLNSSIQCEGYTNRCSACYNTYSHIFVWLLHTPSLFFSIALVSQPVPLLVALWGMTSQQMLAIMKESAQDVSLAVMKEESVKQALKARAQEA